MGNTQIQNNQQNANDKYNNADAILKPIENRSYHQQQQLIPQNEYQQKQQLQQNQYAYQNQLSNIYHKPVNYNNQQINYEPETKSSVKQKEIEQNYIIFRIENTSSFAISKKIDDPNIDIKNRVQFNHPHLMKTYGIKQQENSIFFEYLDQNNKINFLQKQYFINDKDILILAKSIGGAISYLQENKIFHGDLSCENIYFCSQSGCFKIYDNELFGGPGQAFELTRQKIKQGLLAPELIEPSQDPNLKVLKENFYKADVYSFGLVLLQAMTLKPSESLYDKNSTLNINEMNSRLQYASQFYTPELCHMVRLMLAIDTFLRPDCVQAYRALSQKEMWEDNQKHFIEKAKPYQYKVPFPPGWDPNKASEAISQQQQEQNQQMYKQQYINYMNQHKDKDKDKSQLPQQKVQLIQQEQQPQYYYEQPQQVQQQLNQSVQQAQQQQKQNNQQEEMNKQQDLIEQQQMQQQLKQSQIIQQENKQQYQQQQQIIQKQQHQQYQKIFQQNNLANNSQINQIRDPMKYSMNNHKNQIQITYIPNDQQEELKKQYIKQQPLDQYQKQPQYKQQQKQQYYQYQQQQQYNINLKMNPFDPNYFQKNPFQSDVMKQSQNSQIYEKPRSSLQNHNINKSGQKLQYADVNNQIIVQNNIQNTLVYQDQKNSLDEQIQKMQNQYNFPLDLPYTRQLNQQLGNGEIEPVEQKIVEQQPQAQEMLQATLDKIRQHLEQSKKLIENYNSKSENQCQNI